jgi:hypothetical protein
LKSQRQVDTQRAAEFAQKHKMTFLETSALDATNVEKAFDALLEGAMMGNVDDDDDGGHLPTLSATRHS